MHNENITIVDNSYSREVHKYKLFGKEEKNT